MMDSLDHQRIEKRVQLFAKEMEQYDAQDQEQLSEIDKKLEVGLKNAAQGEYGIHFASTKIDDIKSSLDLLDAQMQTQIQKAVKMKETVNGQNVSISAPLSLIEKKVKEVLDRFPKILKVEKQIELLKEDEKDGKLEGLENSFRAYLSQLNQKPSASSESEETNSKWKEREDMLLFAGYQEDSNASQYGDAPETPPEEEVKVATQEEDTEGAEDHNSDE